MAAVAGGLLAPVDGVAVLAEAAAGRVSQAGLLTQWPGRVGAPPVVPAYTPQWFITVRAPLP
jgi:hypothetical protein